MRQLNVLLKTGFVYFLFVSFLDAILSFLDAGKAVSGGVFLNEIGKISAFRHSPHPPSRLGLKVTGRRQRSSHSEFCVDK